MTFGQKRNLDKVKRKMIFEKTVFYDILYLSIIQIKRDGIESVNKSKRGIRAGTVERKVELIGLFALWIVWKYQI